MKAKGPPETLEDFLARGGTVQRIDRGVTGHLSLSVSSPEGKQRSVEKVAARKANRRRRGRPI